MVNPRTIPAPEAEPRPPSVPAAQGFVGSAMLVSGITLLSRLLGLGREAALAALLGRGGISDAFLMAFLIPNLFRRLFGEGALASAFIPIYSRRRRRHRRLARSLVWLSLLSLLGLTAVLTAGGWLILWGLRWLVPMSQTGLFTTELTALMLPYMPMVCLVALMGGVLQVHGRFAPVAAAPILLSLGVIGGCLLAGSQLTEWEAHRLEEAAWFVGLCVLGAGMAQVLWVGLALGGVQRPSLRRWSKAWKDLRRLAALMGPMILGVGVLQVNTLMDGLIAVGLSAPADLSQASGMGVPWLGGAAPYPIESGGYTLLQFAQRLYHFPLGVFSIALSTAIFPALAAAAGEATDRSGKQISSSDSSDQAESVDRSVGGDFGRILRRGLRLSVFIALPAGVGLMLVSVPLSRVIFERGQFQRDDALAVVAPLLAYASAVWIYSINHLLIRAMHARQDAASPVRIALGAMGLNLGLNLSLVWWLGIVALACSTAISAAAQAGLLLWVLHRRGERPLDAQVVRSWAGSLGLTGLMALAVGPIVAWGEPASIDTAGCLLLLGAAVSAGAAVYGLGAWVVGAQELRWLIKRRV